MEGKNCPNCGAIYTLEDVKCPYCGTLYLDMGMIDLAEHTPIFIRYRVPYDKESNTMNYFGKDYAYITQCAIPRLETMEVSYDTSDYTDWAGNVIARYHNRTNATTNLKFEAVPYGKEHKLFEITMEE